MSTEELQRESSDEPPAPFASLRQRRWVLALTALYLSALVLTLVTANRGLRDAATSRALARLGEDTERVAAALGGPLLRAGGRELSAEVTRVARVTGLRVSVIGPNGELLADSRGPSPEPDPVGSLLERPEVRDALRRGEGADRRAGASGGGEFLYVARPAPGGGVVRLARDVSEIEAQSAGTGEVLMLAGALSLPFFLLGAVALAPVALRPLDELRRATRSLARGDLDLRLPFRSDEELGALSQAIHELGEQLRRRLRETDEERQQLEAVLDGMVEGVLVLDAEGRMVLANDRWRAFFDVWSDVRGRRLLELVRSPELEELLAEATKHIARYKLPKAFVFVDAIQRSPSGKADYRWAKAQAENAAAK